MRKQKGMTLIGMLFIAVIIGFTAIIGMKLFPAYLEFFQIKKNLKSIKNQGGPEMTVKDAKLAFEKRAAIDDIKSITANDLEIKGTGADMTIEASYSLKVPLVYNVSACLDFSASSN
jgi:Tfp pilus assembly major pilin PilA